MDCPRQPSGDSAVVTPAAAKQPKAVKRRILTAGIFELVLLLSRPFREIISP